MIIELNTHERKAILAAQAESRHANDRLSAVVVGILAAHERDATGEIKLAADLSSIELLETTHAI